MRPEVVVLGAAGALVALALTSVTLWNRVQQQSVGLGSKQLRDFRLRRVLRVSDTEIAVLGYFQSDRKMKSAVLVVQTAALDSSKLDTLLPAISLHEVFVNDIYHTFLGDVSRELKPFKVNLIYPASEAHVLKHTDQRFHMAVETKQVYQQITRPFIEAIPKEKIEWVYNILEHKKESERIVFEDPDPSTGFILLPDFKWTDTTKLDSAYCLAIVNDRSLRSLRDLDASHLPLLRNIRDESLKALESKYGLRRSSVRVYVHYLPTYYHLHVHFSHVKIPYGTHTGKAVLLEDIIYNLSCSSDHYKNATLSIAMGEMQHKPLFELFREHKVLELE